MKIEKYIKLMNYLLAWKQDKILVSDVLDYIYLINGDNMKKNISEMLREIADKVEKLPEKPFHPQKYELIEDCFEIQRLLADL